MKKLLINLLPSEFTVEKKQKAKKNLVLRSSILALIFMIIVTAVTFGFGIYQGASIKDLESQIEQSQIQVASLKEKEGVVTILSGRLAKIVSLSKKESAPAQSFLLISALAEGKVKIQSFVTEKDKVRLTALAPNPANVDEFFGSLTDPVQNRGFITSVKVDSLGKAKNDLTFDLVIGLSPGGRK